MIKSFLLLLAILSYINALPHNIAAFSSTNVILPARNIQQLIPQVTQWAPTNLPTIRSSYGVRLDQFVRYLNAPLLSTTPLRAYNIHVPGFTEQIPTGVHFAVPLDIPATSNQVILSSNFPQTIGNPIQPTNPSVPLQSPPQASSNIPLSLKPQLTNPLGTQYVPQFVTPTKPTTTNPNQNNVNTPNSISFNSPSNDQNFGQSLGPMFIQTTKTPVNNNDQNIPINTFLPPRMFNTPIIPNQLPNTITVPKHQYETPIRGSNSVPNTNLYSAPPNVAGATQPEQREQQMPETTRHSSQPSSKNIHTLNSIPLLLPYN